MCWISSIHAASFPARARPGPRAHRRAGPALLIVAAALLATPARAATAPDPELRARLKSALEQPLDFPDRFEQLCLDSHMVLSIFGDYAEVGLKNAGR